MSAKYYFFQNFDAALSKLIEFRKQYDGSEIHRAGIIQAFEFSFEQCWKAIQKKAGNEGVLIASPKKAIEWAMTNSWISPLKENQWLEMMNDRNLTSHTYREQTSLEVAARILTSHFLELSLILEKMKKSEELKR